MKNNIENSKINFSEWATLMDRVYGVNGHVGVLYALTAVFREDIIKLTGSCPNLFLYGAAATGKSALANSISVLYPNTLKPLGLQSQATDSNFINQFSKNKIAVFNEFDDSIKEDRFISLKAAYNGCALIRGKQEIGAPVIMIAQQISKRDNSAIIHRSIVLNMKTIKKTRIDLDYLKDLEYKGLQHLIEEIETHREAVNKYFEATYFRFLKGLRHSLFKRMSKRMEENETAPLRYKERIVRNYCVLLTILWIFLSRIELPILFDEFFDYAVDMIDKLNHEC